MNSQNQINIDKIQFTNAQPNVQYIHKTIFKNAKHNLEAHKYTCTFLNVSMCMDWLLNPHLQVFFFPCQINVFQLSFINQMWVFSLVSFQYTALLNALMPWLVDITISSLANNKLYNQKLHTFGVWLSEWQN